MSSSACTLYNLLTNKIDVKMCVGLGVTLGIALDVSNGCHTVNNTQRITHTVQWLSLCIVRIQQAFKGSVWKKNGEKRSLSAHSKRNRTNAFKCIFLVYKTCLSIFDYKFEQLRPLEVCTKAFLESSMIKFKIAQNGIILQFFIDNANS